MRCKIMQQVIYMGLTIDPVLHNKFVCLTCISYITRAIPKSTSDCLVERIQNTEQNFIIWNRYIHICITSPHSCHPHLGTCHTVALAFAVPHQRTAPPSYAAKF